MNLFKESENIIVFNVEKESLNLEKFLFEQDLSRRLFTKLYRNKHIYVN